MATEARQARWEIVDAHRCTACGHLDQDGYRMVEHLRTHDEHTCPTSGYCDTCDELGLNTYHGGGW